VEGEREREIEEIAIILAGALKSAPGERGALCALLGRGAGWLACLELPLPLASNGRGRGGRRPPCD